ncbi:hypothetical protein ACJMK2_038354 [Sinanodonta woodiana]|uniref:Uncharacterized protein n=1 Tax=Sinanodonta woodiana TaxID=1069815 RepID=A0ABD3WC41_SINWO
MKIVLLRLLHCIAITLLLDYKVSSFTDFPTYGSDVDDDTFEEAAVNEDLLLHLLRNNIASNDLPILEGHHYLTKVSPFRDVYSTFKQMTNMAKHPMRKRKVFWQPLGYSPAGADVGAATKHSSGTGSGSGGNVFRYG